MANGKTTFVLATKNPVDQKHCWKIVAIKSSNGSHSPRTVSQQNDVPATSPSDWLIDISRLSHIWMHSRHWHSPEQTSYIVRPIVRKHHQEEANRNQYDAGQFHSSEIRLVQDDIERWEGTHGCLISRERERYRRRERGREDANWWCFANLPADTGTLVISPNVTNMLYVTAALNCVKMWKTVKRRNDSVESSDRGHYLPSLLSFVFTQNENASNE